MRESPTKELIVKRWDSSGRYDLSMVAVRAIILGRFIGGSFPKILAKKITRNARILLQNIIPCWMWICILSSAMRPSVVQ